MSKSTKQYGLLLPKKAALSAPKAGNIFGEEDDSESDDGADWVKKAIKAEGEKHKIKKQTRLNMEKALNEDPTIYQYDEVYDEIEKVKEHKKPVKQELKQPKYIHNLLKAAERRKIEQEHRMERMVQKEREAEGEKYADKESFVTSAYREKLEQFRKIEEEEERMERLEAIADVTKQPDMSGFHRHLFAQTFDPKQDESHDKENNLQASPSQSPNIDRDEDLSVDSSSEAQSDSDDNCRSERDCKEIVKEKNKRQYRKRVEQSESESDEDLPENPENEAERHVGPDDTLDEDDDSKIESPAKKPRLSPETTDDPKAELKLANNEEEKPFKTPEPKPEQQKPAKKMEPASKKLEEKKTSIWEKRTVGPIFEAAVERYMARKALRLSGA